MLINHPWARLLAPSQMVEIHEVFSKFGEHKLCADSALGVGRAPAYHVSPGNLAYRYSASAANVLLCAQMGMGMDQLRPKSSRR
eukprot:scaffold4245_cov140-Isochrysis_galbana.AAC.1